MSKTKSKNLILKICMSKTYCGETRYDFLDPEEKVMIFNAMEIYSESNLAKIAELREALRATRKLNLHLYEPSTIGNTVYLKIEQALKNSEQ